MQQLDSGIMDKAILLLLAKGVSVRRTFSADRHPQRPCRQCKQKEKGKNMKNAREPARDNFVHFHPTVDCTLGIYYNLLTASQRTRQIDTNKKLDYTRIGIPGY